MKLTGVAARSVGVWIRLIFVAIAFVPKVTAAIIVIPGPVVAGYYVVLVAKLFTFGIEILQHDGLDYRKSLVVAFAFWSGLAFQLDWIFPEYFQAPWGEMLGNGVTVGGLTVVGLTWFEELTGPRRRRLRVALGADAYRKMEAFLAKLGVSRRWNEEMTERIRAVGEEMLLPLMRREEARGGGQEESAACCGRRGQYGAAGVHRRDGRGEPRYRMAMLSGRRAGGWNGRSPSGCCGTTPRPCDTTIATTPT